MLTLKETPFNDFIINVEGSAKITKVCHNEHTRTNLALTFDENIQPKAMQDIVPEGVPPWKVARAIAALYFSAHVPNINTNRPDEADIDERTLVLSTHFLSIEQAIAELGLSENKNISINVRELTTSGNTEGSAIGNVNEYLFGSDDLSDLHTSQKQDIEMHRPNAVLVSGGYVHNGVSNPWFDLSENSVAFEYSRLKIERNPYNAGWEKKYSQHGIVAQAIKQILGENAPKNIEGYHFDTHGYILETKNRWNSRICTEADVYFLSHDQALFERFIQAFSLEQTYEKALAAQPNYASDADTNLSHLEV